ncbi:phosphoadenosine phosphosulfate reductase family protein [Erythrobacter colymbi]|uniref:phosphoadenosine phosphosulfate reductase domain-containing protein n=1 Tax=Erythrobacter colymbi TaxID=1161202 RepID=UPI000A372B74|nr:phosphoadenosine phosphosulfate reductase family protein [Erythrobacter colymbi]
MNALSVLRAGTFPGAPPIALPTAIKAALRQGAWVVFNLSGGKDSSAALFAAMPMLDALGHPRDRRIAIHADLGRAEWDSTAQTVASIAARADIALTIRQRQSGDLFDRWNQRFEAGKARYEALSTYNLIGPWSSASLRFCTSEQKAQVIGPYLARLLAGETIIQVIGIRRDESRARAIAPDWKHDTRFAANGNRAGTRMMIWHPVIDWSTADIFAFHEANAIPLHEAYTRYRSSRLSCRYCVLQSLADQQAAASAPSNQEAFIHLVELEARSTFSFQPGRWLADSAPHLIPASLTASVARAKEDADERRRLESTMPHDLRFQKGWPPRVPTPEEAARIAKARDPLLRRHALENRFPHGDDVRGRFAELIAAKSSGARQPHAPPRNLS